MVPGVHPQLTVDEVLERWPATAVVFVRRCMACLGCAMAPLDTLEEAATVYGIELDAFLGELRRTAARHEGGQT
jgi:hybrid cluster-associated redox disulfide protein